MTQASVIGTFRRWRRAVFWGWLGVACGACNSAEVERCRSDYLAAHALVEHVNPKEVTSVNGALDAVTGALTACERAELVEELKQLRAVRRKLQSMSEYLERSGENKPPTPEELAQWEKDGDPNCPSGQTYQSRQNGKPIRCRGPQVVSMNWAQALAHFKRRDFRIQENAGELKAESGSESYTFHFSRPGDDAAARCLDVFAAPGMPWEESVARVTGAAPQRLRQGQPVKSKAGTFAIKHVSDDTQAIYHLGDCEQ